MSSPTTRDAGFLQGGGAMGPRIRSHAWTGTPLGPAEGWPPSLKTAVRIMLASRQPMFVWWGSELIKLYNDPYRAILGGKDPDALGRPASEVWNEIWDQVVPRVASVLERGEGTYDESLLLIMNRHGYPEETYHTLSFTPIPGDDDRPGGIIGATTEDTDRILAERQLGLLQALAATGSDATTVERAAQLAAAALARNPHDVPFAALYLIGRDRGGARLLGRAGIADGHPAIPDPLPIGPDGPWPVALVQRGGEPVQVTDLGRRFDSLPCGAWPRPPDAAVVTPLVLPGETDVAGVLVMALNPFRRYDDRYREFIDLVTAHTVTVLANAAAFGAERRRAESLAELDRAKTAFFSNVSHEFRTPLTLMLGPLDEALGQDQTGYRPPDRERLEVVRRNGDRLLKLVNTLLDFSRLEAGRATATFEPTDLPAFTAELASLFRAAVEQANLELIVDCPPADEPVYLDRDLWEKIVLNLISNAFKFTLDGEIEVRTRLHERTAELSVRDTGTGIPAAEVPNLFNRFHRVAGARGRTHEGTGIGLALVQGLTRLHGGTVEVESAAGRGSTFRVRLPLGRSHLPAEQVVGGRPARPSGSQRSPYVTEALGWLPAGDSSAPATKAGPAAGPDPGRPTIVLADDNRDMRDYVRRLLANEYRVIPTANGDDALAAARLHRPDLVITDVMMPGLGGLGLLEALREDPRLADVPVIMVSARAGETARVEGLTAGVDHYLVKPFAARELIAAVSATLAQSAARREAAAAIEESGRRYRLVAEVANDFIWDWDLVTGKSVQNEGARKLFGHDPSTMTEAGAWGQRFIHPDDHDRVEASVQATLEGTDGFWRSDFRFRRADGTYADVIGRGQVERDGAGRPVRMVGSVTDVSHLKRAEAELRLQATMLSQVTDAVIVVGTDRRIIYLNRAAEHQYGVSAASVVGRTLADVYENIWPGPDDEARAWAAIEADGYWSGEIRQRRPDASIIPVDVTATALRDDANQILGYIGVLRDITDRARAEAALQHANQVLEERVRERTRELREANAKFQAMYDQGQFAGIVDRDGILTDANRSLIEASGYSRASALGKPVWDAPWWGSSPEIRDGLRAAVERALRGDPFHGGASYHQADGTERFVDVALMPIRNEDDAIAFLLLTGLDITDRWRTEEVRRAGDVLRQSERRFRHLADHAPVMVWVTDRDGACSFLSKSWYQFTGQSPETGLGEGWMAVIHPADRSAARTAFQGAHARLEPFRREYRIRRHDGAYRWAIDTAAPWIDDDGRFNGHIGSVIDITEMKAKEEALEASERIYRTIGESIDYGVWICDPEGRNLYASESFLRLVGMTQEECSAFGWGRALHPADAQATLDAWQACVAAGAEWDTEHRYLGVDGAWHPVLARGLPVRNERGEITAWAGINLDITRLKHVEHELRQADRRKNEFLATLAHELRNPLAPIRNALSILELGAGDQAATTEARRMLDRQVRQLVRLVDDLLDLSRISRGMIELRKGPVDLRDAIRDAVETCRPLLDERRHRLDLSLSAEPAIVDGDRTRLAQVFANLLNNAAKFTDPGGHVTLTMERGAGDLLVRVRDSGIGIEPQKLDLVFQMFTQLDRQPDRRDGLGVGLSLVRHIVAMHGGSIAAASTGLGHGSTFSVSLPVQAPAGAGLGTAPVATPARPSGGHRILLADDNPDSAASMATLLGLLGNEVQVAHDGVRVLELAERFQPDAILLDLGMPRLDGYEACRQLRGRSWTRSTLILALTGWGHDEAKQRAREAGFDFHLVKPVDVSVVADLLAEHAGRRSRTGVS